MTQTYCWQDENGAWQVGHAAMVRSGSIGPTQQARTAGGLCLLIRHYHTGDLEWVSNSLLRPYPESPIPEPTK